VYNKQHPDSQLPSPDESVDSKNRTLKRNQYSIDLNESLTSHDPKSLTKCCETLAFLVRDAAHITPHNFESCVHTIRTFVEASLNGGNVHCFQNELRFQLNRIKCYLSIISNPKQVYFDRYILTLLNVIMSINVFQVIH